MSKGLLFGWTDKQGNKLTASEFMNRWKQGMREVTPLQQLKAQLPSYVLILIGVILGLVVSWTNETWWLVIILFATLIINMVSLLSLWQRYKMLRDIDDELKQIKEVNNGQDNKNIE